MNRIRNISRTPRTVVFLGVVLLGLRSGAAAEEDRGPTPPECIRVKSSQSLIHLGSLDSFDITLAGTAAARALLVHLDEGDPERLREAIRVYESIIPNENFGGEYTALKWIAECLLAEGEQRKAMLADRYAAEFLAFFAENDFERLKDYLRRKYYLDEIVDDTKVGTRRQRFHEDFILFNNPRRPLWEKTDKIVQAVGIKPGDVVADVGCGSGFFTFRFAELVGETGRVYAIDTGEDHIEYVSRVAQKFGLRNVLPSLTFTECSHVGITDKVDCFFMCSLYHVLYATMTTEERDAYMKSLRDSLKDSGRLVIVDNDLVDDRTLPYHGPYVSKELVIRQLHFYGFKLVADHQFIPQRYTLIFEKVPVPDSLPSPQPGQYPVDCVPVTSRASLIWVLTGGRDTGYTNGGREAARLLHRALETKAPPDVRATIEAYDQLVPKERFGDEYTAFQWFCRYLLASDGERPDMLADRHVRDYFEIASDNDFALLKKYIKNKYELDAVYEEDRRTPEEIARGRQLQLIAQPSDVTDEQVITWGEIFTYANPSRAQWEKTSKILDFLKIQPGDSIGDVGCGAGYYTFKFADRVGPRGRVFAADLNEVVLDHVAEAARKHSLPVVPVLARENITHLPPQSCDLVFVCTMYHAVYVTSIEYVKDGFIDSIKRALKPGGRFVIVDNTMLPAAQNPFYGPRIARELIISQLHHYGFRLVESAQIIPQRYILVFEME